MKHRYHAILNLLFLLAAFLCGVSICPGADTNLVAPAAVQSRLLSEQHALWAHPLFAPGITNFYQVTTNLYRGSQPTAQGMAQLKAMGIKTVINLRSFHSDADLVVGTGLKSVRFEVKPWHAEEEDVV